MHAGFFNRGNTFNRTNQFTFDCALAVYSNNCNNLVPVPLTVVAASCPLGSMGRKLWLDQKQPYGDNLCNTPRSGLDRIIAIYGIVLQIR